ncbi:MAG: AzlD domain-containing protein [Firmicutes bacterium]|nr:AzlD domain-containing protein [Candidatus Colimorpha enterica]
MKNYFAYLAVMAITTYLLRVIPLIFNKEIKSGFINRVIYFIPAACLTAMTFPSVLFSTSSVISGIAGFVTAIVISLFFKNLVISAAVSAVAVLIVELIIK